MTDIAVQCEECTCENSSILAQNSENEETLSPASTSSSCSTCSSEQRKNFHFGFLKNQRLSAVLNRETIHEVDEEDSEINDIETAVIAV